MKFKHSFKNYAMLCASLVLVLLGVYGVLVLTNSIKNTAPKPITVSSVVNCSFPDKSFCATDQLMRGYVSSKDFSDILENQTPVNMSCASKAAAQQYCNGSQNNLVVQLFKVQKSEGSVLYTRNGYIDFFHNFFQQEGPFSFDHETESGPTVTMSYTASGHEVEYSLHFVKQNSTWVLSYVAISNA
jgi:hypothetical protein